MTKRTILVVDDQVMNRQILAKFLSDEYEVLEAGDGKEALDILNEYKNIISAVVLDIVMPVMDGFQVLEEMRKDKDLSVIPVLVSSQNDGDKAELHALSLGAQDFVIKPYRADLIRHRLKNTIRLRESAAIVNKAQKDEVTGLYNQTFFHEKVGEVLQLHDDERYDLLYIGIERFRMICDTYGEMKADELLRYIAQIMITNYNKALVSGHFSGENFYMLIAHQEEYNNDFFQCWIDEVNQFPIEMDIKMYFGVYQITDITVPVSSMCRWAQFSAETNRGKYNTLFSIYDDQIRKSIMDEQFITSSMRAALEEHQFEVYYQPKYDLRTEKVAGAEALVRWNHPEKGLISPGAFIPVFEKNGFIIPLDAYVWETACRDIRNWIDKGVQIAAVSVNVSRADIYNPQLIDILTGLVKKYNIPQSYLHLEVTESAYTDDSKQIISTVKRLRALGFVIEMDDFGSGYSSLNMLAEMPVDILKLDMRFIQTETAKESGRGILSFVISLAKWMNLSVIAEGVETPEQLTILRSMDCNFVQGYYYAKPMPEKEFQHILCTSAISEIGIEAAQSDIKKIMIDQDRKTSEDHVMLIVDDVEANRASLTATFENQYYVVEKQNGKEAWEYLEEYAYKVDVILLDLLMPVMDGFQLLDRIRNDERMIDIPVIVTSQGDSKSEHKALMLGADDFISKPYDPDVVKKRVANVLLSHEAKNNQLQGRYRYILDNLDIAFFEYDEMGNFYSSDKFSQYVLSQENIVDIINDQGNYEGVHPDDIPIWFEFFKMKEAHHEKVSVTLRLKMKDGSYRWTEMLGFFDFDQAGNRVKSMRVLRDVDKEWLRQNRRLQDALNAAETANKAKTDFLSRVSHDMRTPLNGILGLTYIISQKLQDDSICPELQQLEQSGKYLLNLVDDTLDVSRIESGTLELTPKVCDGKTAFETVFSMVKPSVEAKNIHLNVHAENLPFTKLYIDVGRVQQAVMNILTNAIKFTPDGGTIDFIMENLSQKDGVITDRIIIRDTGIGMSKEFMKKLFEPFSQEHNDSRSIYRGTGLGLTITKQCMELMGGSVEIQSEEGKGTEVTLILPMPEATQEQITEWNYARKDANNMDILSGKRVLLCEDHPLNAIIATQILERRDMIVEHAENGLEGLEMFEKSTENYYDVILMDIRMPVMDGVEATRKIRSLERNDALDVPIIAMTANVMTEDVNNSINAGMSAHLGKPIEPEQLYKTLVEYIITPHPYMGRKVLVVDDIAMNRGMVKKAIGCSYNVLEASNGEEALRILADEGDVAAVITDIQMPLLDGKELIKNIRSKKKYDRVAILANTIYGDHRQEDELLLIGANDFVYKPASPRVILMRLERILRNM